MPIKFDADTNAVFLSCGVILQNKQKQEFHPKEDDDKYKQTE